MTSHPTQESVLKLLSSVIDPKTGVDVVSLRMVSPIVVRESVIGFAIESDAYSIKELEGIKLRCTGVLNENFPLHTATVVVTAPKTVKETDRKIYKEGKKRDKKNNTQPKRIPGIKNIILIASGKGGVGKSTISVNIALTLRDQGYKVGIIDADIYGPSVPQILGINKTPETKDEFIIPLSEHGIKSMSIGYIIEKSDVTIWRGPMISKAIFQLFCNTAWGTLDYLIVDTPPGTGDIPLSIGENFIVNGALLVTTPQDLCIENTLKSFYMFQKLNIPVIGMIENMSYIKIKDEKFYPFGISNIGDFSKKLNISVLGKVPFYTTDSREKKAFGSVSGNKEIISIYEKICSYVLFKKALNTNV